jgi:beta-phosphoglucomutase
VRWQAAIFDLDGVLADSAVLHYAAWKRLADDLSIPFDPAANEPLKGVDRMRSLRLLLARGGRSASEAEMLAMADTKNLYYRDLIETVTPGDLLPGVEPLLAQASAAALALAVASASRNAAALLQKLGIADRFDFVADAGAIANPKPAPDIFLACAHALAVEPARCIGFEDAAAGIEAILAARMLAIGIGDPLALAGAHRIYPTPAAIDLAAILALSGVPQDQMGRQHG